LRLQKKGDSQSLNVTRSVQTTNQASYRASGHGHVFLAEESYVNGMASFHSSSLY